MATENRDIRWKQRYQNFDKTFSSLRAVLENKELNEFNDLEQEGIIQRFEYTYELALNTIKDYMDENGVVLKENNPRAAIKEAFAAGIIEDGQTFINMMLSRNTVAHRYDFAEFMKVLGQIKSEYIPAFINLHSFLTERL